ncbi:MAG: hypothetical protein JRD89_03020 [Deltaproteobacteria bacterium]|nr:hypothetical protein [Deltaproteobacteria bacterium]
MATTREINNCSECHFLHVKIGSMGDTYTCNPYSPSCSGMLVLRGPNQPFPTKPPPECYWRIHGPLTIRLAPDLEQ